VSDYFRNQCPLSSEYAIGSPNFSNTRIKGKGVLQMTIVVGLVSFRLLLGRTERYAARPLRVEFAGAIYHLMSQGNRREPIFLDNEDRKTFLRTLGEACEKTGWQVHAYCLMGNHFHPEFRRILPGVASSSSAGWNSAAAKANRRRCWPPCAGDGVGVRRIFSNA
jgi:hypothetical protein